MKYTDIYWSKHALLELERKHSLLPKEVEEVFSGHYKLKRSSKVYYAYGQSEKGKYIFVVFRNYREGVKVITARIMTKSEKRFYRNG